MDQINGQTSIEDFLGTLINQQPSAQEKMKTPKSATSEITKETRIESFNQTEKQPLRQLVLDVLDGKELTAKEIAEALYKKHKLQYPARAIIQPRITELVESGIIEAVGKKLDTETDRKVAVYKVV